MYKTGFYNDVTREQMIAFAREQEFAFVTGCGSEFPVASQLPLEINETESKLVFSGHLMRKTDHHLAFLQNPNVLVLFHSPHAFIDANWYTAPAVGSTVNYMTVQAKGKIIFRNEEGTRSAVHRITDKYIGKESPASFDRLPETYINSLVKAIAGFDIEVQSMEAVFKLSQGKESEDRQSIINGLNKRGRPGDIYIANKMRDL